MKRDNDVCAPERHIVLLTKVQSIVQPIACMLFPTLEMERGPEVGKRGCVDTVVHEGGWDGGLMDVVNS